MGDSKIENAGVEAIEAKCKALYGEQKGYHFGVKVPYILGGPDPLDQVSIYKSNSGGIPHWHYISYGLTELYQKDSDYEEESGYGFELSFRLEDKGEQTPPVWPVSLMQNLARYVFKSGNVFKANEHMDANGPICLGTETKLTAFGFDIDPELGDMDTPYGHVEFIRSFLTQKKNSNTRCSGSVKSSLRRTANIIRWQLQSWTETLICRSLNSRRKSKQESSRTVHPPACSILMLQTWRSANWKDISISIL